VEPHRCQEGKMQGNSD